MGKFKIKYISKSKLHPAFGCADGRSKPPVAYIRKDLPKIVQKYILEHELFHLRDFEKVKKGKYNPIIGEIKANLYGFIKQPLGAIVCLFMSLHPARIKFYLTGFKNWEPPKAR